ncbi:hypothetical protein AZ09_04405 [Acetobacter aceti 1023]|nr:hypothetical protein AZ09_04405 [Acetobacter aceti 1023]
MPVSGSIVFDISSKQFSNHNVLPFPNLLSLRKGGGVMASGTPTPQRAGKGADNTAHKGGRPGDADVSIPLTRCDTSHGNTESAPPVPEDGSVSTRACQQAQRPGTSAQMVASMVGLRRRGYSFRRIGREVGRCMEGVRQVLMRYEDALKAQSPAHAPQPKGYAELVRDPEPLPAGHPIAMRGLWKGLEHWQPTQTHTPTTWQQDEAALAQALLWNGGAA